MKLPKKVDSQFIVRVIKNEVSPEEKEFFDQWLLESNDNKEEFSNLLFLWERLGKVRIPSSPNKQKQWEKIASSINDSIPSSIFNKKLSSPGLFTKKPFYNTRKFYYSSALFSVILIVFFLFFFSKDKVEEGNNPLAENSSKITHLKEVSSEKGQNLKLTLQDGSVISLNSDSKIFYPENFAQDKREVELIGEAYFVIEPDKNKPFLVKCGGITTKVTGTEFNIKFRDKKFNLTVSKGSVEARSNKSDVSYSLTKGESVSAFDNELQEPVKVNLDHNIAWQNNHLSFSQTPLHEVMSELERVYNVKVIYKNNSVKHRTITGKFDKESLDDIVLLLSLTLDIDISFSGNTIVVK